MATDKWRDGPELPSTARVLYGRGLSYNEKIYFLSTPGQVFRLDSDRWTEVASLGVKLSPMSFSGQLFEFDTEMLQCTGGGNILT